MATKEQISAFFAKWAPFAKQASKVTGVPTSVILAQAAHESAYGTSRLSQQGLNFFGVKAGDSWSGPTMQLYDTMENSYSDYRVYTSPLDALLDWSQNVIGGSRYNAARTSNPFSSIKAIKDAGYATDPNYVSKVTSIITGNNLTQYDMEGQGSIDAPPSMTLIPSIKTRLKNGIPIDDPITQYTVDNIANHPTDWLQAYKKGIDDAMAAGYMVDSKGEISFPINAPFVSGNEALQDIALMTMVGPESQWNFAGEDNSSKMTLTGHLTQIALIIGVLVVMVVAIFRMFPKASDAVKTVAKAATTGGE